MTDVLTHAELLKVSSKNRREADRLLTAAARIASEQSIRDARKVWDDCLPVSMNPAAATPQVRETWADLSAWSSGTKMQVSGGRLYTAAGTVDSTTGINKAIDFTTSATWTRVTRYTNVAGGTGGMAIGTSSTSAGGAFAAAAFKGLYHHDNRWYVLDAGAETNPDGSGSAAAGSGDYKVTETLDANYYSIYVHSLLDPTLRWYKRWARTSYSPLNWSFYGTHSAGSSGKSFGPSAFIPALSTAVPRASIETTGNSAWWTSIPVVTAGSTNNCDVMLQLPATYDPRTPVPLAIVFHGNGGTETAPAGSGNPKLIAKRLLDRGFAVLGANNGSTTWGAQKAIDGYVAAYLWAKSKIPIASVVLVAESMGGIESELVLADRRIPGIVAWIGTSPTASLNAAYTEGDTSFVSVINSAYSISGDYAAKTAGHDPALMPGDAFRGVPMLFLHATDDTTVLKAHHTDVLAAKVQPYSPEVVVVTGITGGHGYTMSSTHLNTVEAFACKYAVVT